MLFSAYPARTFPETQHLAPSTASGLLAELAELGLAGGAVFDALVGAVARQARVPLISCDRRAAATYHALGVDVEVL